MKKINIKEKQLKAAIQWMQKIEPEQDLADSRWRFYLQIGRGKWEKLSVTLYDKNYYFSFAGSDVQICYPGEKDRIAWDSQEIDWIIKGLRSEVTKMLKDPKLYIRDLNRALPLRYREGMLPRKWLMLYVNDLYRPENKLGVRQSKIFVRWVEKNIYSTEPGLKSINLQTYLDYCKVAYQANAKELGIKGTETGLQLYKRFADNRHEGLLDLKPESADEFEKWYHSRRGGGHPWEIYRGGNTTHIDLGIHYDERRGWEIFLNAESTSRLVETARIALAFVEKKMPFKLSSAKSMRLKLLGLDNIGIVPEWYTTHRANQDFPQELNVYDCIKLADLHGKEERKIIHLISWFPIQPLLPSVK